MAYTFPFETTAEEHLHTDYAVPVGFCTVTVREFNNRNERHCFPDPEWIHVHSDYHDWDIKIGQLAVEIFNLAREEYDESVCPVCERKGEYGPPDSEAPCPLCNERGYIRPNKYRVVDCPDCKGVGGDPAGLCERCSQSGKTLEEVA